ncbi:protein phosphatase 1, regulatory (inhibitor) subunit 14Aa isoform X1 [Nerophis lumbriciformis]|uniref:protein phosphatase 1, regulatory (inhibitor) subunit 14Aa isoform X1 n=1 Tax=Nerophis lumbriciformis TaxID=546530 RepID=UPI002AE0B23B|nr:uncharacterized protein LOC133607341 isoform X1 [Nerophis lumbriciformis]XP_061819226.1 uncharacterized protein LOC133608066 isoform X1 [Nerophis lumbriciformis]
MAADRTRTTLEENDDVHRTEEGFQEQAGHVPKRHGRVTVKYNRKELQRRLDVEKWIDESLDVLYAGQEGDIPEEVNIDDLIDLPDDMQRMNKLQELLQTCNNNTEVFVGRLSSESWWRSSREFKSRKSSRAKASSIRSSVTATIAMSLITSTTHTTSKTPQARTRPSDETHTQHTHWS